MNQKEIIIDQLKAMGFEPVELGDAGFVFKYEDMNYLYMPDDDDEQFLRIVRDHGADRILFGSDSPWSKADEDIASIRALPLGEEEKTAILGGNAARLLGIC